MDADSKVVPKYYRISRQIIERIRSGELRPGMRVPSENELIRRHGISNTTARKALYEIEAEGWCTRVKGKGTFVRERSVQRSATRILAFTRNMREAGYTPSTRVLDARRVEKGYSAIINGRRYAMTGPVYKIHRLRFADETPMMIEVRYISLEFCPGIESKDFTGSLYEIYEKDYGLHLVEIQQMLSTIMLDATTQRFFDLSESVPALRVEGVTFCGKEMILEMEDSIYRGDKYRFSVSARPGTNNHAW
ncbi:MAG: GntR family transcriptional regulator [Sedimentisphaerales bacterium]|nr:GntR family transcriptional regulator [Sedimentisphaerales bacterium]